MILSMKEQGLIFIFICALGFIFGIIYDFFRILRRAFHHPSLLCFAEDFLYWAFAAFFVLYVLLGINYGEVRLYMVIGFIGGMIVYYETLSPLIIDFAIGVLRLIKNIIIKLTAVVIKPLKILLIPLKIIIKSLKSLLKNKVKCGIISIRAFLKGIGRQFKWQRPLIKKNRQKTKD